MTSTVLTIGEFAQRSGLTTHTIRYYESAGVLKPSSRAANGHRRYLASDVLWMDFVLKLKQIGMPLAEIVCYAQLRERGAETVQQRLAMLQLHRERLAAKMLELSACCTVLDEKIHIYEGWIDQA